MGADFIDGAPSGGGFADERGACDGLRNLKNYQNWWKTFKTYENDEKLIKIDDKFIEIDEKLKNDDVEKSKYEEGARRISQRANTDSKHQIVPVEKNVKIWKLYAKFQTDMKNRVQFVHFCVRNELFLTETFFFFFILI